MVSISGALIAAAWVINAYANSLALLYLGAAVGGVGAEIIYGASIGNALKWFPDRRGLAAGLTRSWFWCGLRADDHTNRWFVRRAATRRRSSGSVSDKALW